MNDSKLELVVENQREEKTNFGFWVYLMTDCVLFASLFATYEVLHRNTFGGPSTTQVYNLRYVLIETLILLTSSFTCGLANINLRQDNKRNTLMFFILTFILGVIFLFLELKEFRHLFIEGNSWQKSGFLSSYFVLVGTHGLHILIGLLWMGGLMIQAFYKNLTKRI